MMKSVFQPTHKLAKEAFQLGMLDKQTYEEVAAFVPDCRYCGKKLWQDDCELQDDQYCSMECVELHEYEMAENAATGN